MGLISALTEQFTRKKALEEAEQEFQAQQQRAQGNYDVLAQVPAIAPQSPQEAMDLQRAGYIQGGQDPNARSYSPTAFVTPERMMMANEQEFQNYKANQAYDDYQETLNNPLVNLGDTALDIANNTIGLPFQAFGNELFNNPSEKARKRYEQSLEDISTLHGVNQQHYLSKRRERDDAFLTGMGGSTKPSAVREYEYFSNLLPEQQTDFMNIKRGSRTVDLGNRKVTLDASGNLVDEYGMRLKPNEELDYLRRANAEKAAGTQGENRIQTVINDGFVAAQTLPTIKRSISLLDGIKTGGFAAARLKSKQLFGIEGADEGELSNLLGKAVISQYRQVFGAQFTQEEGKKLDAIEAGLSKSTEANIRVLNNVLKLAEEKVKLSKDFATRRGDQDSIYLLDSYSNFDLGSDSGSSIDNLVDQYAD